MSNVLDRIPVGRISAQAHEVRFGRTVLTVVTAVLFAIGWVAGALWLAVAWSAVAVKVGWTEAARKPTGGSHGTG